MATQKETWLRLGQVQRLTGWTDEYIAKLVKSGVLKVWRPFPRAKLLYRKSQVQRLMRVEE